MKQLLMILVAILFMSCNSNEPEIYDGIGGGHKNQNGITNDNPKAAWEELYQAYQLYWEAKYDEAHTAMQKFVEKYKDKNIDAARQALVCIERIIYEQTGGSIDEILSMLEMCSQGDSRFATFARYRIGFNYAYSKGEYDKGIEILKGIEFDDDYHRQMRLCDLGFMNYQAWRTMPYGNCKYSREEYREEACKYFLELLNTYPYCDMSADYDVIGRLRDMGYGI